MLLLVASLAIGVVSHILWDLFTHEGRWGVTLLPALDQQWGPLVGYKWLQHGSSLVGIAIITVWVVLCLRRREAAASVPRLVPSWLRWTWWLSLPGVLVVAWLVGLAAFGPLDAEFTVAHLGCRVLPPACALWGMFTLALAIGIQFARKRELAVLDESGETWAALVSLPAGVSDGHREFAEAHRYGERERGEDDAYGHHRVALASAS